MSKARELANLGNAYSDGALSNRNKLINGAMVIDQRNGGASITPTVSGTYSVDRWTTILSVASKFSVQQNAGSVTPPSGFSNYIGVTSLSAYTVGATETFALSQRVEGFNAADLGWGTADAKDVTLSFWVRSSLTGTFGGSFRNSANNRSYPFSYTINSANTWEYKTITISGDTAGTWLTNNGVGVEVMLGLGSGSTRSGTAGSWAGANYTNATGATSVVGTNGATFYITGVQLEVGDTATPFEHRSYSDTLHACQRYYEVINGGVYNHTMNDGYSRVYADYKVTKRASPTITGSSGVQDGHVNRLYVAAYNSGVSIGTNTTVDSEL